jgi:hypothetical protein
MATVQLDERRVSALTAPTALRAKSRFYVNVTLFVVVLNLVSFGPSLIAPASRTVPLPLTRLVVAHAIVSVSFLLAFLIQTLLVANRRTPLHRRFGVLVVVLAAAFVVVGWIASVAEARRGFDLSGDLIARGTAQDAALILAPLNALVMFEC